jgi:glutamate dehydrogenase (NAD(P)+)
VITELAPERTVHLSFADSGAKATLVIDRTMGGISWGGLRIVEKFDDDEIIACARTMTRKFAFVGIPRGGAKAALRLPPVEAHQREHLLRDLGKQLSTVLRTREWMPALDMGSTPADIELLYHGAGIDMDLSSWTHRSAAFTAWTILYSALAACQWRGQKIEGKRFVVLGFGRVGSETALLLAKHGARLVGVSTRFGAIADTDGLDVGALTDWKSREGDSFVATFPEADRIRQDELFDLHPEIVIPAATSWSINDENHIRLNPAIIPCAANAAMKVDIERKLCAAGSIVIPDFIANCGGVFGSLLEGHLPERDIQGIIRQSFQPRVLDLIERASRLHRSVSDVALEDLEQKKATLVTRAGKAAFSIGSKILPLMPAAVRRKILVPYSRKRFFRA